MFVPELISISKFSVSFKLREVFVYLDVILLHRHRTIMWYSFGVGWLNSRGVGVVLKFDVLPHWDAVFCAAVCMLAMKHSVANVPREQQLYWWC